MKTFYELSNDITIPTIGMGTWPLKGDILKSAMKSAIEVGYRLFDTADNYGNESEIGEILSEKIIAREDIFIVTKISDEKNNISPWSSIGKYFYKTSPYMQSHTAKEVVEMLVDNSLKKLRTDYIDCLIMHWPYPDYLLEIWDSMCDLYKNGKLRSIGVSNCRERHLEKIIQNSSITPMVNQISISPLDTRMSLQEYCKNHRIQLMCYAPIMMRTNKLIQQSDIIKSVLKKHNISIEQLLLAWNIKQNIIPIPKSSSKERQQNNFNAVNINLTDEEIHLISTLNKDMQYLPESKFCPGL